jgi:hypothetical protein
MVSLKKSEVSEVICFGFDVSPDRPILIFENDVKPDGKGFVLIRNYIGRR